MEKKQPVFSIFSMSQTQLATVGTNKAGIKQVLHYLSHRCPSWSEIGSPSQMYCKEILEIHRIFPFWVNLPEPDMVPSLLSLTFTKCHYGISFIFGPIFRQYDTHGDSISDA